MFLHNKGNHWKNEKTMHGTGENTCQWCSQQGINIQNIPRVHTT